MTSFIGKQPTTGDFKKLDAITTSATTTFNLRHGGVAIYPQSAMHCIVSLNGIIQSPIDAFNIVNDTIVFASALTSNDVINHIIVLGNVNDIGTPSDDTVSTSKLQNDAVNGAKIADDSINSEHYADGSIDNAHIADDQIDSEHYVAGSIDLEHMSSESVDEDNLHISNAGTNGQYLQKQSSNTGGLTWADAGGGGLVFLKSYGGSSNRYDIILDDFRDDAYEFYKVYGRYTPATTNSDLNFRFFSSGTTTVTTAKYNSVMDGAVGDLLNQTTHLKFASWELNKGYLADAVDNAQPTVVDLTVYMQHDSSRLTKPALWGTIGSWLHDENTATWNVHSFLDADQDVEGLQFFQSSGNMDDYDFYVYGIKKA